MDKKALYNLLQRYIDNSCTAEERRMIDQWLEILQDDEIFASYTALDLNKLHNKIWQGIESATTPVYTLNTQLPAKVKPIRSLYKWLAVASISGLLVIAGWKFSSQLDNNSVPGFLADSSIGELIKKENTSSGSQTLLLEDSTTIVLQPGAVFYYPTHFKKDQREVYLEGKAYFDVSKNAKRPFFIYHNNLVTHVLGTSFSIDTRIHKGQAEVAVFSGKVEVSENKKIVKIQKNNNGNGVVLTPNQRVVYSETTGAFVASIVDRPLPVNVKKEVHFQFEDESMATVLSEISKEYALEIIPENENIYKCTFTGNLSQRDLYSKLEAICQTINATYEIKGTKILIKGRGCD